MNPEPETLTLANPEPPASRTDKGVGSGDWLGVRHSAIRELETAASKDFSCPPGAGWYVVPVTLRKANDFVACYHRHTGRTSRNGGKFAVGLAHEGVLKGCAILGNPLSATLMDGTTAEVLRVCVLARVESDGRTPTDNLHARNGKRGEPARRRMESRGQNQAVRGRVAQSRGRMRPHAHARHGYGETALAGIDNPAGKTGGRR